jgi:hypothetical protein
VHTVFFKAIRAYVTVVAFVGLGNLAALERRSISEAVTRVEHFAVAGTIVALLVMTVKIDKTAGHGRVGTHSTVLHTHTVVAALIIVNPVAVVTLFAIFNNTITAAYNRASGFHTRSPSTFTPFSGTHGLCTTLIKRRLGGVETGVTTWLGTNLL